MSDTDPKAKSSHEAELAAFFGALSKWFDGMSKFIEMTKQHWEHAPAGYHLMAQKLGRHTLKLKQDAGALSERYRSLDPNESEAPRSAEGVSDGSS